MNSKTLVQILKSEPMKFTLEEIQSIMDEELEKSPAEMDTDLVDMCAEVLARGYNKEEQKKTGKLLRIKVSRAAALAAAVVAVVALAVTVTAGRNTNPELEKFVKLEGDFYNIDLRGGLSAEEVSAHESYNSIPELQRLGIDNIVLPSEICGYSFSDIKIRDTDLCLSICFNVAASDSEINGYVLISRYKETFSDLAGVEKNPNTDYSVDMFTVNGFNVLLFNKKNNVYIQYLDGNTEYFIDLSDCDYDSAKEIIMSLK